MINKLGHVNIRTNHLRKLTVFYQRVLGLTPGPRPAFKFDGAWLYCGSQSVVHLVDSTETLRWDRVQLEHFALKGTDFSDTDDHLQKALVPFRVSPVPGFNMTQIHLADPDGNHIEINFDGDYASNPPGP